MKKAISILMVLVLAMSANIANADFSFGEPVNLGPIVNTPSLDSQPSISADGLSLFFYSEQSGGYGNGDIWVARRTTKNDAWTTVENVGSSINTSYRDSGPDISADGLTLFFNSDRPGGSGESDIWVATRTTKSDPWGTPVNLGPNVNSSSYDAYPSVSSDGLTLFMQSNRPGGYGKHDIWMTTRQTKDNPWTTSVNLGLTINSSSIDGDPTISPDNLVLLFTSLRPGGYGISDMYMVRRTTMYDSWGLLINLGPIVNSSSIEAAPSISTDGLTIYFDCERPGGQGSGDLWQSQIIPIVDLNDDGIVDAADICIMIDHWGTDNQLCDIGPMPWGDGIVDVEDLKVLAEHLFEEPPQRPQVTTVVIVRHAEKLNDSLTEDGEKRAETLAVLISNIGVSAIFSTNLTRTIETANNTADRLDIPIQFYTSISGVADLIKSEYTGKVVLVVGHSNTVTQTVQALGVSSVPQFDGRYDNLYIVRIHPDGLAVLTHLRFDINPNL
jgi:Tol biopolymer transport system component/phosphohistidine phosphatase SixA